MIINNYKILYEGALFTIIKSQDYFSLETIQNIFNLKYFFTISLFNSAEENNISIDLLNLHSLKTIEKYFPKIDIKMI